MEQFTYQKPARLPGSGRKHACRVACPCGWDADGFGPTAASARADARRKAAGHAAAGATS